MPTSSAIHLPSCLTKADVYTLVKMTYHKETCKAVVYLFFMTFRAHVSTMSRFLR